MEGFVSRVLSVEDAFVFRLGRGGFQGSRRVQGFSVSPFFDSLICRRQVCVEIITFVFYEAAKDFEGGMGVPRVTSDVRHLGMGPFRREVVGELFS